VALLRGRWWSSGSGSNSELWKAPGSAHKDGKRVRRLNTDGVVKTEARHGGNRGEAWWWWLTEGGQEALARTQCKWWGSPLIATSTGSDMTVRGGG
jgi:hypothetical protein